MKIVKLEGDRVKVILSPNDLEEMDISAEEINPNSPEISDFMSEILKIVKEETGFSLENGQVIVEATTFGMGVILVFSKIKRDRKNNCGVKMGERVAFEFYGFDDLIGMLKNVSYADILDMKLYQYKNSFFVTVPKGSVPILIYEYSLNNQNSAVAESILSEYGKYLADGKRILGMVLEIKKAN